MRLFQLLQCSTLATNLIRGSGGYINRFKLSNAPFSDFALQALEKLADETTKIADELYQIISDDEHHGKRTRLKSLQQAVKSAWNKNKTMETEARLVAIRDELQFRIIVSMMSNVDTKSSTSEYDLQSFDNATKKIMQAILSNGSDLHSVLEEQTNKLFYQNQVVESAAIKRHEETLSAIQRVTTGLHSSADNSNISAKVDPSKLIQTIKSYLHFPMILDRYEDINPAHKRTCEWIYHNNGGSHWPSFKNWLENGTGLYWISGKAGSGKSTLMKFLKDDKRMKDALKIWAGNVPLVISSFYFWNTGTELQKSTKGMFQTLLYQILDQASELGPLLFPELFVQNPNWLDFPRENQLKQAFRQLIGQKTIPCKLVLVIDGLDEFDDSQSSMSELAEIFTAAIDSANIKIVVSSRPLPVFEESFAQFPKLRLHELTRGDIAAYVNDKIGQNKRMMQLETEDPIGTKKLVTEIVESASGVFLWVKLVVTSLLEGLRNFDKLSDLERRLRELPRGLEELFQHMWNKIPPEYRAQSSQIIQLLRHSLYLDTKSRRAMAEVFPLTALGLSFAELDPGAIIKADIRPLTSVEIEMKKEETEGRLKSRCAGLLEFQPWQPRTVGPNAHLSMRPSFMHKEDVRVQYLHKSVADFFGKPEVWDNVISQTTGTSFNPSVALLYSYVMRIKTSSNDFSNIEDFRSLWHLVLSTMQMARFCELFTGQGQEEALDEIDRVMTAHFKTLPKEPFLAISCENWCDTSEYSYVREVPWHDNFLAFTVQHGLKHYVEAKLDRHGKQIAIKNGRPLLDYACTPLPPYGIYQDAINPAMVKMLLQIGLDPNEQFNGCTPWLNAISPSSINFFKQFTILKLLLEHGADPNAYVERDHDTPQGKQKRRYSALFFMREVIFKMNLIESPSCAQPQLAHEVIQLMKSKGARAEVWHEKLGSSGSEFEKYPLSKEEFPWLSSDDLHSRKRWRKSVTKLRIILRS